MSDSNFRKDLEILLSDNGTQKIDKHLSDTYLAILGSEELLETNDPSIYPTLAHQIELLVDISGDCPEKLYAAERIKLNQAQAQFHAEQISQIVTSGVKKEAIAQEVFDLLPEHVHSLLLAAKAFNPNPTPTLNKTMSHLSYVINSLSLYEDQTPEDQELIFPRIHNYISGIPALVNTINQSIQHTLVGV